MFRWKQTSKLPHRAGENWVLAKTNGCIWLRWPADSVINDTVMNPWMTLMSASFAVHDVLLRTSNMDTYRLLVTTMIYVRFSDGGPNIGTYNLPFKQVYVIFSVPSVSYLILFHLTCAGEISRISSYSSRLISVGYRKFFVAAECHFPICKILFVFFNINYYHKLQRFKHWGKRYCRQF